MPPGEEMFVYHGYSGPCPKPPLPKVDKTVENTPKGDAVDTAALVTWLRDLEAQAQRLAECDGDLADIASVKAFKACADLIERQGKALRAVESLESFGATVELTTLLGTREMVTGAEVEVVSAAQLRAALAQTETPTADGEGQ